ncbi:hypothetical protein [Candidatus Odyssella acanthamoebae]|uniref:Peptidase S74 domain-containing protein n=1 Tax=Candidatus Odyssella acanthamoebae TaxID=91604 RepID=A0A077AYK2_9PROT|nr:hypothetical protein [Candidatus Paracaedibacter acanthamoebae]AIK96703.1 hypothetical protein ID47_08185 [Candidatus Paracaedibacter acanthamoebae]
MVKFAKIILSILTVILSHVAWADPIVDEVLEDLQSGSSSYSSYSSSGRCTTTKNCTEYFQQKLRQLTDKYKSSQNRLNRTTQQADIDLLTKKLEVVRNLSQRLPLLLKSTVFYPQNLIFKAMSAQGQTKYRQGYRIEVPNFDSGFDVLSIDPAHLTETDTTILEQLTHEVHDMVDKAHRMATPPYTIKHIKGMSLSYDDILNDLLTKIDSQDYTRMDREAALRIQLNLLDNVKGHIATDDPALTKLQNLRSAIETEANKAPISMDNLIFFLQTNYQDPSAPLENESDHDWKTMSQTFMPAKQPQQPTPTTLTNLTFDVSVAGKTSKLSAKTIGSRFQEKQRFYSQATIYKEMSPAAQADYRAGKRYTLNQAQMASQIFAPLSQKGTDAMKDSTLEKLRQEIVETIKADLRTRKSPPFQIIEVRGAHYDYDQILSMILTDVEDVQNRPTDRQANLVIDLGIVDKYLQLVDQTDKSYQKLLKLRQKVEGGQDTPTSRYAYGSTVTPPKNQSQEQWLLIKKQLAAPQPALMAKIVNLADITIKVNASGKAYTVSLANAGTANYARRRLTVTTKYAKEKAEILKQLTHNLKAIRCKNRDECRRAYHDEIKAMKARFGGAGYNNNFYSNYSKNSYSDYSSNASSDYNSYGTSYSKRSGPQKAQEIDTAIQEMLENFSTVLMNAFDMDRPQTKLMIYNKLSDKGRADYLNGLRLSDPKEAKIFKRHKPKETQKAKTDKMAIFQSVLSVFGVKQPAAPALAPTPQPQQQINYDAAEKKLLPLAFFDTDDILIYTIQALDRNVTSCRTYSECSNNDSRIIEGITRTLNPKDPVIGFLLEITDELKEAQKSNPIDLDSIAAAFKKAKYSARLRLESEDEKTWESIESQKNKKRQPPVPPRVANAQALIKTYNANTQATAMTGTPLTPPTAPAYGTSSGYPSSSSRYGASSTDKAPSSYGSKAASSYRAPLPYGSSSGPNSSASSYGPSTYSSSSNAYGNSTPNSRNQPSSQRYAETVY